MARSPEELALSEKFAAEYALAQSDVMRDLERAVCGCDYGGTSWTTRDEADRIRALLDLSDGIGLLEIGAGSGWPSLYLAEASGCDATLTDVPIDAMRMATERAAMGPAAGRVRAAAADGAALPFEDGRFDAISHSDVLCCLPRKREVLGECRCVIRDGGRMAFSVIYVAPGLSAAERSRAIDSGPPYVDSEADYPELLESTGWNILHRSDVTAEYEQTGRRHLQEVRARAGRLRELLGAAEFEDMLTRRDKNISAVTDGIVRRDLFCVTPA